MFVWCDDRLLLSENFILAREGNNMELFLGCVFVMMIGGGTFTRFHMVHGPNNFYLGKRTRNGKKKIHRLGTGLSCSYPVRQRS